MIRALVVCLVMCLAAPLAAKDYIRVNKTLPDDEFYRLVACGAPPGGDCAMPFVRWHKRDAQKLTIGITRVDPRYPDRHRAANSAALDRAIALINAAGTDVHIRRDDNNPRIPVLLMNIPEGSTLKGTGVEGLDGTKIEAAHVHIWWNGRREITRSAVIITPSISPKDSPSVLLEELVQGLGLLHDVSGRAYARRSIFAQDDNLTTELRGQDLMVLRRHYGAQ